MDRAASSCVEEDTKDAEECGVEFPRLHLPKGIPHLQLGIMEGAGAWSYSDVK